MSIRKQNIYTEQRVYKHVQIEDLREDVFADARSRALLNRADHPWGRLDDEGLLRSAGLLGKNYATDEEGLSLAAVMRYIQEIEDIWEKRVGKVGPDSAHRAILRALPAMPEFTIPYAILRTGRSRSAVNAALHDLERAEVIRQIGDTHRNRSFEVPAVKVLFERLEGAILSGDVPSREAVSTIDTGIESVLRA